VSVTVPPPPTDGSQPNITRARLTEEKKKLIRLVVAFVIATKHHLRAEGGVHHEDLKGAFASLNTSWKVSAWWVGQMFLVPSQDFCPSISPVLASASYALRVKNRATWPTII
jgi:hypothetical protein